MFAFNGFPIAPSVVVFDAAAGGIRLTDRITGTKYRQYVSGGKTLWEVATAEDNLDITFISTRGPVYADRTTATKYRKYISNGIVLKESITTVEPEDFLFEANHENVMTDRATGTKYREYVNSGIELLEVA